jgi:hypothetical protein
MMIDALFHQKWDPFPKVTGSFFLLPPGLEVPRAKNGDTTPLAPWVNWCSSGCPHKPGQSASSLNKDTRPFGIGRVFGERHPQRVFFSIGRECQRKIAKA